MSLTNYINETVNELMENESLQNLEDGVVIEGNNEENGNKIVEENKNKNLKNRKRSAKARRNINPAPTECCICERIASGYLFYGVNCCDGCKHFFNRSITSKNKYKCEKDGNCNLSNSNFLQLNVIWSLIAAQNKQFLDYLLTVEQNACRTRASGIDECHYNSSFNSLASLLTRKENLIAMKHMIGLHKYPKSGRDPIEGHRVFSNRPKPMTDDEQNIVLNHYGPLPGAKRYAELLHLIEFCFNCANNHSLFLNYVAYVTDQDYFHNSMPEALVDISLGCKT
uniref:Nuclear receptor domain-containing protein n=1 Tax=Meloidogyne floridensis TaxID=298350 RepID=A0A915NAB2_9BILA